MPVLLTQYAGFYDIDIEVSSELLENIGFPKVTLIESLRSPSLETIITCQAPIDLPGYPVKNYDEFYGATVTVTLANPNIPDYPPIQFTQVIYRMENRRAFSTDMETWTLRACDQSVLNNQFSRVSQQYNCQTPSTVVNDILSNCIRPKSQWIESSNPSRNYIANNIHPYQVIAEQAEVALTGDQDPSFLHFMTYRNGGEHNFRSIQRMVQVGGSAWTYIKTDPGSAGGFTGNPTGIQGYEFPCDFDLLTDVLNGIDDSGRVSASVATFNPWDFSPSLVNGGLLTCSGFGEINNDEVMSEADTQNECGIQIEKYHMKRQARMSLIHEDKIALRLFVPFNQAIFSGDLIEVKFPDRYEPTRYDYGTGEYLIVKLKHEVGEGGNGRTTIDCVSESVGRGLT